jgi:hypothetical protein
MNNGRPAGRSRVPPNLARRLVIAQPDKHRVAKQPVFGPFEVGDLDYKLRTQPMDF